MTCILAKLLAQNEEICKILSINKFANMSAHLNHVDLIAIRSE